MTALPLAACILLTAAPVPQDTFLDADTRRLVARARDARIEASRIIEYQALVRHRLAVGLRTPLRDRTVFRFEGASKVWWSRDDTDRVRVLAARVQSPLGIAGPANPSGFSVDELFDPAGDPLVLGIRDHLFDDDTGEFRDFRHPLDPDAGRHYRYATGDTLRIRLTGDRLIEAVEVKLLPREASPLTLVGSLWIEPGSGAMVQAVYRLADVMDSDRDLTLSRDPDVAQLASLGPLRLHVRVVTVEYSLWQYRHWLPHRLRAEIVGEAAGMSVPGSLEITYEILEVATEDGRVTASRGGEAAAIETDPADHRTMRRRQQGSDIAVVTPRNPDRLADSPWLPPPIWQDAPDFMSGEEAGALYDRLVEEAELPRRRRPDVAWRLPHQDPGLFHYNRVDELSLGIGLRVDYRPWAVDAVARTATAHLVPRGSVHGTHRGLGRTLDARIFRQVVAVNDRGLGLGGSLQALLFGVDIGEYYDVTGLELGIGPPETSRPWGRAALFAERHRPLSTRTHAALPALWRDHAFRPNIAAEPADLVGLRVAARPWVGRPDGFQAGLEADIEAATGDAAYASLAAALRILAPLPGPLRAGVQFGAGHIFGDVLPQLAFRLGGAGSLAGRRPSALVGTTFARARAELALDLPAASVVAFADAGWAGAPTNLARASPLPAAGLGVSLLEGFLRADAAYALREGQRWRFELYLDGLL